MTLTINQTISDWYFGTNTKTFAPSTVASAGNTFYWNYIAIVPGTSYWIEVANQDQAYSISTWTTLPTAASLTGKRVLLPLQSAGTGTCPTYFTAGVDEYFLCFYAGNTTTSTGLSEVTIEEISIPANHKYNSIKQLITAGTQNMTTVINNVGYDESAVTTSAPSWIKWNNVNLSTIYISGNSAYGYTSYTGYNWKFNQRDAKVYYCWKEEGTCQGLKFYKLRWRGYSAYSTTAAAYLTEWDLFFFENGNAFIFPYIIPTSSYNGTFNIIASSTYSYTAPTYQNPGVIFYTQNINNTVFQVNYGLIDLFHSWYTKKYLIKSGLSYYTIVDNTLTPITVDTLTSQTFIDNGCNTMPTWNLISTLSDPNILGWAAEAKVFMNGQIEATPVLPQTIIGHINMSDPTITGIGSAHAVYTGTVTVQYSFDNKATWSEPVNLNTFISTTNWLEFYTASLTYGPWFKFSLYADATFTGFRLNYTYSSSTIES